MAWAITAKGSLEKVTADVSAAAYAGDPDGPEAVQFEAVKTNLLLMLALASSVGHTQASVSARGWLDHVSSCLLSTSSK